MADCQGRRVMVSFIIRRMLQTLLVLVIVTFVVFLVMHSMPGDPVVMYLGPDATVEQIDYYTHVFGLDQPLLVQYGKWVAGLCRGEMGRSIVYRRPIASIVWPRLRVTLTVALPAFLIAVVLGVGLGVVAALRRGKLADSVITVFVNIGMAMPVFWLSILLVFVLSLKLGWLPVQGFTRPSEDLAAAVRKLIMPVGVLALGPMASLARQTRSAMLEVVRQDYVRTARAKGVPEGSVIVAHALRNALIPIVTLMGMQLGYMLGGSVLIEQVYVIPGMGNMLITAILNKDYLLVQSMVLVIAAGVSIFNLLVDIAYGLIDPRIRVS
jgi:peptide/nickel transport system permease protein